MGRGRHRSGVEERIELEDISTQRKLKLLIATLCSVPSAVLSPVNFRKAHLGVSPMTHLFAILS